MSILLQANELSKEYGGVKIFSKLSFSVSEKQKIGVIGRNGAGKSTLFRILTGEEQADDGKIIIGKEAKIGYLKQGNDFNNNESSLEYLKRNSGKEDWKIKKLACKFRFDNERLSQASLSLSGGWRIRLKLIAMLLKEPNIFLLDEPTNYLDLDTQILLENYLESYKGSFLIISHDREFLKKTCEETIEISSSGSYHYPGKIESYLAFKEQKMSTMARANEGIKRQQEHLQDFVTRFQYKASKAKQAQAFIKKINKLEKKRISIEHRAGITRIIIPPISGRHNFALKIKNLSIGYNSEPVVTEINFDCRSGERLAILGLNGQGKTTLLKTLANELPLIDGSFRWAADTRLAYHGPDPIERMNNKEQVEGFLRKMASPSEKNENILKMAGNFLFRGDDLKKNIGMLSGGEKSRLLLAGLLLSHPDIFLLDEPTCHLDFETVEALGEALGKFKGTVIFASHDRTFSSLITTGLVEVKNGQARRLLDDYNEYVEKLEEELAIENKIKEGAKQKIKNNKNPERDHGAEKENRKKISTLEKQLEKLNLEQLKLLEYFLANPVEYDIQKAKDLEEVKKAIAEKEDEWLAINF